MKKEKTKKISYETIRKNKKLGEFVKDKVIARTKEAVKLTWDLVRKWTKK